MDTRVNPSSASPDTSAERLPWRWDNRFAALGPAFYTQLAPTPLRTPYWVAASRAMARELGLEPGEWQTPGALEALSGNRPVAGAEPLAGVYSGHQFGVWAGQLGDGRAILLGGAVAPDGRNLEIQLKGSGLTPYSRMGDGRAVLRSSIREFLASEAMHALGIPTTRALCVTGSPTPVRRETVETAAVVTRVAPSFIRFGHFEHFSHGGQHDALKTLADFVIDGFYPECRDASRPYAALLAAVTRRTAALIARWQAVGFCHGVMNTDNMSILGLTIDYGPFQFMDGFDNRHNSNHSDHQGRYAYGRQSQVAYWNLFCLAQALLPLIGEQDDAIAALEPYKTLFVAEWQAAFGAKLGFAERFEGEIELAEGALNLMHKEKTDFTIFWRRLAHAVRSGDTQPVRDLFVDQTGIAAWLLSFRELPVAVGQSPDADLMLRHNPAVVLRNHMAESAIAAAREGDFSVTQTLHSVLETPFDAHPDHPAWTGFPPDWASSIEISCSS
jgi:uncharacterized protein YdiU (UPF0061 family)